MMSRNSRLYMRGYLMERLTSLFLHIFCGFVFLFLILPIFVVVPISFSSATYLKFPPPGFSLQWYNNFFTSQDWTSATIMSLQVASITTAIATVLGTLLAISLLRGNFRGKILIFSFAVSPMIVPVIIIAISVYFFYSKLQVVGTMTGLVAAHTILAIPYVFVIVTATLQGFDETLERASLSLGANPLKTFLFVTLPSIKSGVMSAALFAFITSFDELVIAIFISGTSAVTLPKRMWDGIRLEIDPTIAAVSSLLIGFSVLVFIVAGLTKRSK